MTPDKTKTAFALLLMAAAFFFAFFGLSRPFWAVECCTVEIADASWSGILENLKTNAHSPPLYYFLLKLWMGLWGTGEATARALSSVFYLFSIASAFFLGKTLYDQKTAILCAFFFMLNPMAVQFAQFARMYSLLSLLGILSTLFFLRQFYSGPPSKRNLALYIIVNVAGTFTHYWFFFLLMAQGAAYLALLSKTSLKSFIAAGLVSAAPFFALWTPVLLVQMANGGTSEFVRPGPYTLLNTLLLFWGGGAKAALLYLAFFALLFIGFKGWKIRLRPKTEWRSFLAEKRPLIVLTLLLVSLGVPWTISQSYPVYEPAKYPVLVLFTVVLFAAAVLARFGTRLLAVFVCSVLFLAVATGLVRGRTNPPADSPRAVTDYLLKRMEPGDVVVFATNSWGPAAYYLKRAQSLATLAPFIFPAEQAEHPCWTNPGKWLKAKTALTIEAEKLADRIDSAAGTTGGKIWLLTGWLPDLNDMIKAELDARFQAVDERLLGASYRPLRGKIFVFQNSPRARDER